MPLPMRSSFAALFVAAFLGACSQTTNNTPPPGDSSTMRTGSPLDEEACLDAVAEKANNTVTVLSSEFSEANTLVMVGVGPERARWRCLVSKGVVAEVTFAGSEGNL